MEEERRKAQRAEREGASTIRDSELRIQAAKNAAEKVTADTKAWREAYEMAMGQQIRTENERLKAEAVEESKRLKAEADKEKERLKAEVDKEKGKRDAEWARLRDEVKDTRDEIKVTHDKLALDKRLLDHEKRSLDDEKRSIADEKRSLEERAKQLALNENTVAKLLAQLTQAVTTAETCAAAARDSARRATDALAKIRWTSNPANVDRHRCRGENGGRGSDCGGEVRQGEHLVKCFAECRSIPMSR